MNILKIPLPEGLHNSHCLYANQYENWLSEEHLFHAHPSTPSPCNHTETADAMLPENGWYACIHHESDTRYSYAMRCALVKSNNRLGVPMSRSYNNTYTPTEVQRRIHPFAVPHLSFVSEDDYRGLRVGFHGQDIMRHRHDAHNCLDCLHPDNSAHPANGDVCLIMQLHSRPEFDDNPDYSGTLQQFMVVTRVLSEDQALLYTSVSYPRILRTAIFSTGIAHHVVCGSVARTITAPSWIELRICRLAAQPFHTMRDLTVAHFVHPCLRIDRSNSYRSPFKDGEDYTLTSRAYRMAQRVQQAYVSATTVPSSPDVLVLFRSSVDQEVTAMHLFVLEYACPAFSTVVGYQRRAASSNGDQTIPCTQSTPVLRMVQTMLYTGEINPCSEGSHGHLPFTLRTLCELFMFTQQFNLLGWLANFELFLNAAIIYYGLGVAASHETQLSYNEFLQWLRVVQPVGIRDAVALGCLTYSQSRWGVVGVTPKWLEAAMLRLQFYQAHVIHRGNSASAEPRAVTMFKSVGTSITRKVSPRMRASQRGTSDVSDPEIRVELNPVAYCADCRYFKDILGKSFFECLTSEACCQNVETCASCQAADMADTCSTH